MVGFFVDRAIGLSWVESSLSDGSPLAMSCVVSLQRAAFRVLVRGDAEVVDAGDFEVGCGVDSAEADGHVNELFGELVAAGAEVLLVEDDLARRGDPVRNGPVAFVGDRVLRWCSLASPGGRDSAVMLLRNGSSGYPLNAFVVSESIGRLGLVGGGEIDDACCEAIVGSLVAVIVAAFDAETYLVAEIDQDAQDDY